MDSDDREVANQVGEEHLHALDVKSGKGVCFEFSRTGKCSYKTKFGSCEYSHDPEDVAKFKAAELQGPAYAQRLKDGVGHYVRGVYVRMKDGGSNSRQQSSPPGRHSPPRNRAASGVQRSRRRDV